MFVSSFMFRCKNIVKFRIIPEGTDTVIWEGHDFDIVDMPENIAQMFVREFDFSEDGCTVWVSKEEN